MNVLTQVRQMLKTSFLNPVSGETERIQRCFVACSKEITKEAMNSIEGELDNQLDKLVEWLHPGTNLYDKIEEFLPEQGIFEKLSSVQEELDKATKNTPYKLVADSDKKISILGKNEKAHEEMPFEVKTSFKFDKKTKEGKEALEKFKEHFEKGSPIEIDGKHIEFFELPDFIPEWMKPNMTENAKLVLSPNRSDFIVPLRIERKLLNEDVANIDIINLEIVQSGTEEFTLKNDRQNVPWQFTFVFNRKENSFKFEFTNKFYGFNVAQHLQSFKFFDSMSKNGETTIFHADTGLKIVNSDKTKAEINENFDGWIELLQALVIIQEKIPVLLTLLDGKLTNEEINRIFEVASIVKEGKLKANVSATTTITSLENAVEAAERFGNEAVNPILISYSDGWKTNILGNEIDLGVAVVTFDVFIKENDFKELERSIKANQNEIEIHLTPKGENAIVDFLKWDCEDRHTRI